jgi:hypothetical protein
VTVLIGVVHKEKAHPSAERTGSNVHVVSCLGSPATHYIRAGGFASHSLERFAFFTTRAVNLFIGSNALKLKIYFVICIDRYWLPAVKPQKALNSKR